MRHPRISSILIGTLIFLAFAGGSLLDLVTDSWWFGNLGYQHVFWTRIRWEYGIWALVFSLFFLSLGFNYLVSLWTNRSGQQETFIFERLIANEIPVRAFKLMIWGGIFLVSLIAAGAAYGGWEEILLYLNAQPFGKTDPIFGEDISFYLFELPFWEYSHIVLQQLFFWNMIFAAGLQVLTLKMDEPVRLASILRGGGFRKILFFATLWLLTYCLGLWLDRFQLLYSESGVVFGAGYTDIHARLNGLNILLVLSFGALAVLLFSFISGRFMPAVYSAGGLIAATIILLGVYPWAQQQFVVAPNELEKEREYIKHNIAFTRLAYGLERITPEKYPAGKLLTAQDIKDNAVTVDNIRLWDYRPLLRTYRQLQEIRLYYRFPDVDIDRYTIDGRLRQVMLAAREFEWNQVPEKARTWVNQRLKYTHGYGVVASPVNRITADGLPEFLVKDFPPKSKADVLNVTRPEIYYGEEPANYVFTGTTTEEFDFPRGDTNAYNRYEGKGGVPLNSFFRRLVYAMDKKSYKILISEYMNDNTRILYRRNIDRRVREVAPFVRLDGDPYLVIYKGRLKWMVDGYTVSNRFPYSEPVDRMDNSRSALRHLSVRRVLRGDVNYVRNSVKVVLDAYDGDIDFYLADDTDPIISTWSKIFPGVFKPLTDLEPGLRKHIRYPADFFRVQSQVLTAYHMNNPQVFYNQEDLWRTPFEIYDGRKQPMEPYYVIMKFADNEKVEFVLIQPFTPVNKDNMVAWIAARCDPENYGKLTLFEFPKQRLVYGPGQIEARIDQDPQISRQFTLWSQKGSRVIRGNLIVLPVNKSLLYVEPVYLRAEQGQLPELKRIIVAHGKDVVMADTLEGALLKIFSNKLGAVSSQKSGKQGTELGQAMEFTAADWLKSAQQSMKDGELALQKGDWAAYGKAQQAVKNALKNLAKSLQTTQ